MSVFSKALSAAVMVSLVSGCAASSKTSIATSDLIKQEETKAIGANDIPGKESTAVSSSAAESNTTAQLPADNLPADSSTEQKKYDLVVKDISFNKVDGKASGELQIALSNTAAFESQRTAPSEYVITIPGARVEEQTKLPQIAPQDISGIRSVRAVQGENVAYIRMFVDAGSEITATSKGDKIIIEQKKIAAQVSARAQLAEEKKDQKSEDLAEKKPGDLTKSKVASTPDDSVARENPTGVEASDGSKTYTGRLISLDLQDTDIDNALRIIAEVSNLNIIASDDVTGKVTLRLIDVPWDQALDVILKTNGLDQVTEGNVIRIAPVDKLRQEREVRKEALRALENLESLKVRYFKISYARATELKEQVETVLSERGTVTVDERTNQIIIKDISKGVSAAEDLIKKLDLRTPQVLLETQIVEGSRNILRDLGFQWNLKYTRSPKTGNATGLVFPNTISVGGGINQGQASEQSVSFPAAVTDTSGSALSFLLDSADGSRTVGARISALEQEGKVRVISRPQVATVNNKQAEIKSVEKVRVRLPDSGLSVATGSGAQASGGGSTAFEEIDVGITMKVTPQASSDYYVLLDVNAKSSTFGSTTVDGIPSTLDREATSTILVKSGQTFALGGIYRIEDNDNLDGVPFLKDLPVFGTLFRRSLVDKSDEELIFFLTPHIVEGSFDPSFTKKASQ